MIVKVLETPFISLLFFTIDALGRADPCFVHVTLMYPYPWTLHSNVIVEYIPTTSSVGCFVIIGGDTKYV